LLKVYKKEVNRMNKILNLALMSMIIGVILISGCAPAKEKPKTSGEVMKVAKYYWPGMYWIEIADSKGWFEEAGLNVELVDTNSDYFKSLQDTADGKIDTQAFYLYDLINYNLDGAELIAVINSDDSSGSEALIAKKEILSIPDLKGKRIGISQGTNLEYELSIALGRNGMQLGDVILIDSPGEQLADIFVNGEVDAILTWQPFANLAAEKGNGRKLFDTSEIQGLAPVVSGFKRSFIESRPNDVQAFVNVWHKTTEFIKENPGEAFPIIADIYDVPVGDVQAFTQDDKILDLAENKIAFSYAAGFESLHGTARQINNFMIDKGITDEQLDSTAFLDARFIRGVE
jgi:NitT/TauT family transport system substrate-binding protein